MVLGEACYLASCYSFPHASCLGFCHWVWAELSFSKGRGPGQFGPKSVTLRKRVSESSYPNYSASLTFPGSSWKGAPLFSSWPLSAQCLARRRGQEERADGEPGLPSYSRPVTQQLAVSATPCIKHCKGFLLLFLGQRSRGGKD